jgi:hypothetical protein
MLCVFMCVLFINHNMEYTPPVIVLPWDDIQTNPLGNDKPLSVDTAILSNGSCPHAASIAIWVGVRNASARIMYTRQTLGYGAPTECAYRLFLL